MKQLTKEELNSIRTEIYEKYEKRYNEESGNDSSPLLTILDSTLAAMSDYMEEYQKRVNE